MTEPPLRVNVWVSALLRGATGDIAFEICLWQLGCNKRGVFSADLAVMLGNRALDGHVLADKDQFLEDVAKTIKNILDKRIKQGRL